jgi:Zn-finger domain-containing protein
MSDNLSIGDDAKEISTLAMSARSKRKAEPAASRVDLNLWRSAQMPLSYKRESEEDEKTWRKEMIVDGMDLYVRRDIERKYGSEIRDQILELKKKIKESKKD